jgi:muconate cycloisomerase
MKLIKVEVWQVRVPLLSEWTSSPEFGEHSKQADSRLILALHDEAGHIGWGESSISDGSQFSPDLQRLAAQGIKSPLCQLDLSSPGDSYWSRPVAPSTHSTPVEKLRHRLRHPLQNIVETAWTDLRARRLGVPFGELLGGLWREWVATDYWMGRVTPEHAQLCVKRASSLGFRGVKLKTTLEDPNVERLEAIKAIEPDFHVTVDPNGRFHRLDDALPTIRAMDAVGSMNILEDPFPRFYLPEFAALRNRIAARVVVHLDPVESLWAVLQSGAAGGLNIDSKIIGPFQWRVLAGVAEQANLPVWHGSGLDLGIATATQLHMAGATPNCELPGDQVGPWLREHSLVRDSFEVREGRVKIPEGPGLGVTVDLDALDRYSSWHQSFEK